jgi:hypothetical protein
VKNEDERCKQYAQTYRRRDLGHGGDQEPDDALINKHDNSKFVSITSRRKPLRPHLCPKEAYETRRTSLKVQTGQANEHDEKQDYIG